MSKLNWYGYEPSRDPYFKGKKTTKLNNAIFEAKNYGMDYVRAKYGAQLSSQITKSISHALTGSHYKVGKVPKAEQTTEALTGKQRSAWDSSRMTGNTGMMHANATPDDPNYHPPVAGPPVWKQHGQWNLENDKELAQGNQRPGAQASSISAMITGLLRQSQESAGDTLQGMFSQSPGQYYLGAREGMSAWGVDPVYAEPGSQLPIPTPFGQEPADPNTTTSQAPPSTSLGQQQPGMAPSADDILSSSLGGLGFLAGAQAPGTNVNTTQSSGAPAPGGMGLPATGQAADATPAVAKWAPDGKGGWVWTDPAHPTTPGGTQTQPPAGAPPKPTTPSPITPAPPAADNSTTGYNQYGGVNKPPNAQYNPWGYGLGAGGVDASGKPINATMGPSPGVMANATMQAMALANSYFAPQRLELAYQLGDMETDMRRMAVNLGRQTDDPVLQAKLFKEANQATRTLDTQQNTFAFQMAEQRRQEEQQNWQFYSSLAQEEYKFSNQLDLAQRTFNLQRYQVMNSPSGAAPITNAFGPAAPTPQPGMASPSGSNTSGALEGGNLVAGSLNPYAVRP